MARTTNQVSPDFTRRKLQELLNIKCELKEDDYFFPDCKTILNSDIAALKKVEILLDEHEREGRERFIDMEFGPKDEKDEEGNKMALYTTGEAPRGYIKPEQIEWLYPKEICPEDSKIDFLVGESSSNEVIQGALGD